MVAVVAAHDPPGPAKFGAVVAGHWVSIGTEQAVHADAVAAMVLSRAVAVAATSEMQADMGKFLLLLGFGMLYSFWVSYDVVPPIIDRAAQLLGFARFARVGDLKAMFSGGQEL